MINNETVIPGINGKTNKLLAWAKFLSQVLVIPMIGLMLWAFWNHEERIDDLDISRATVEATRFTSENGLEVWREIAEIRAQLDLKADVLGAAPVLDDIKEIKEELQYIRQNQ